MIVIACVFVLCPGENGDMIVDSGPDKYGCLGSEGYSFVESIGACAQVLEIDTESKCKAASIAVDHVGFEKGLIVISVDIFKCPGCFDINLANGDELTSVYLIDWEVSSVNGVIIHRPSNKNNDNSILIENDFGSKIVYGTSQSLDVSALRIDCESSGGAFDTCGSPCESDAEACIDVCAFTCEYSFD